MLVSEPISVVISSESIWDLSAMEIEDPEVLLALLYATPRLPGWVGSWEAVEGVGH